MAKLRKWNMSVLFIVIFEKKEKKTTFKNCIFFNTNILSKYL